MKISSLKYPALFMGMIILLSMACSIPPLHSPTSSPQTPSTPEPTKPGKTLHFENQWVAFNYPEDFRIYKAGDRTFNPYPDISLGGDLVAGFALPL